MTMDPDTEGLIHMSYTGTLTMELTPLMEALMVDVFDLEGELLRGSREQLPDGRHRLTLQIEDKNKGRLICEFIQALPNHHVTWLN